MKHIYKLTFKKAYLDPDWDTWYEVSDSHLLKALLKLSEYYDFSIVKTKFNDCFEDSVIKIKCKKEDKNKIFSAFCLSVGKYIREVKY